MHVLVIGGGLGGLSAGLAAQQAGHHVTVLERAPRLRDDGAGIGLPPNGVLALDALGLGAQLRERAGTHDHGGGLHDRHGRVLLAADRRAMEARTGATLLAVRRPWLHGLLADALEPGTIRTDCPVTDVRDRGHDVEVTAGGEVVHADAAVVADGAGSRLRTLLFPEHPGLARSGEFAARAVAPHLPSDLPLVVGELLDNRTGDRFGCLPLGDGGAFWYATWKGAAPEDPVLGRRWLRERRAGWHPAVPALIDATAPEEVHVVETSRLRTPLPALARGRIALLGDAAHAMTPDLGQGACQAFEDAVVLGAAVTGSEPFRVAAALREYDAQRRPRTTSLQRESRRMHRLLRMSGPMARLRDAAFRRIPPRLSARALAAQFRFDPPDAASREPLRSR